MKYLTIVTDFKFWERNSGSKNRTYHLIKHLDNFFDMNIVYLNNLAQKEIDLVEFLNLKSDFFYIKKVDNTINRTFEIKEELELKSFTNKDNIYWLNDFLIKNKTKVILNTNLRTHVYMQNLPYAITSIVDLHDLMHQRYKSFESFGQKHHINITKNREFFIINTYDYVIAIQDKEYKTCLKYLDQDKILLMPHSHSINNTYASYTIIKNIGFIATSNQANFISIKWFLDNIWSKIYIKNFKLNIYGTICIDLKKYKSSNIVFHGLIDDLNKVYKNNDVMISPILMGAGLKIKNVEAISHCIPLLTTSKGAEGMEDGINKVFLCSDNIQGWIISIYKLFISKSLRDSLSRNSCIYAKNKFSEETCYSPLVNLLKNK